MNIEINGKIYGIDTREEAEHAYHVLCDELNRREVMEYSRYIADYSNCPTVTGSHSKAKKTIEVYVNAGANSAFRKIFDVKSRIVLDRLKEV